MTAKQIRRRNTAILAGCVVAVALSVAALSNRCERVPELADFRTVHVTVHTGETAWEIAKQYCPKTIDVREYLAWCADANGLSGMGSLKAGETYLFLEAK